MSINNIVFAGPLSNDNQVGGVVLLFEDLVNVDHDEIVVIDTNAKNFSSSLMMVINFFIQCLSAAIKRKSVALHGTARDYKYLGFILLILHYSLGLKYHTRKFGGSYDEVFETYNKFWKFVVSKLLVKSNVNYFETRHLVEYFTKYNTNTFWFPNYRVSNKYQTSEKFHGRMVFVGHVKHEKGIDELLSLDNVLPQGWSVDIYGPVDGYNAADLSRKRVTYKGVVAPESVAETIAKYDILLLPTFHSGEGYPGVVLEAFSVDVPVVVTNWRALSEIVDDTCGALVEPKNADALLRGIKDVAKNYTVLCKGANERFKQFDRELILAAYLKYVSSL